MAHTRLAPAAAVAGGTGLVGAIEDVGDAGIAGDTSALAVPGALLGSGAAPRAAVPQPSPYEACIPRTPGREQ